MSNLYAQQYTLDGVTAQRIQWIEVFGGLREYHNYIEYRKAMKDSEKTQQIIELLRHRHPAPEWATFAELNIGTGSNGGRFIDFYAMNMYPSKRNLKIAYEVKVSRSDFSKELSNPLKRESAEVLSDECYFATPANLVGADELPEGWGLIELNAGGLVCKKKAQQRHVQSLPLSFTLSLARRASDSPSPLPALMWKCAGREVTAEELKEISKDEIEKAVRYAKSEAIKEYEERFNIGELNHLKGVIRRSLGDKYCSPDTLEKWFADQQVGKTQVISPELRREIGLAWQSAGDLERKLASLIRESNIELPRNLGW